ncbi:hypothetical protein D9M71_502790 [compost metagenome]
MVTVKPAPLASHPVLNEAVPVFSRSLSASLSLASKASAGTTMLLESTLVMMWSGAATGAVLPWTFTVRLALLRSPSLSLAVKSIFSIRVVPSSLGGV